MCITRRNAKKASRSLSLSALWPERSRRTSIHDETYPVEAMGDNCDMFDQEISLFLDRYVKPCAQSSNSRHDSGNYSMGSESASASIVSSSSESANISLFTNMKIIPDKVKSEDDRTKNRDTVATVITIIPEQSKICETYSDNPKYRSKANPLSRSHTLPSLSRSSCKTRVSLNGHSYKYYSDI